MKRSEMIRILANSLKLTGNHYCDDERDIEDSDKILSKLEAVGMTPPPRTRLSKMIAADAPGFKWDEE